MDHIVYVPDDGHCHFFVIYANIWKGKLCPLGVFIHICMIFYVWNYSDIILYPCSKDF